MKVSCLMLTLDRYEVTRSTFEKNREALKTEGVELEYLVWDNGSRDHRTLDYFCELRDLRIVKLFHMANKNVGVAQAFNQLCARAKGDVVVLLGNDIELQPGTLAEALRYISAVPRCGIVGVDWGHSGVPPLSEKNGIIAHYLTEQLDKVFGTWFVPRAVIDERGLFCEEYKG